MRDLFRVNFIGFWLSSLIWFAEDVWWDVEAGLLSAGLAGAWNALGGAKMGLGVSDTTIVPETTASAG